MTYIRRILYIFLPLNNSSIKKFFSSFLITTIFISIHTLAYSFQLTFAWDPINEPDIAGYNFYYGTISRNYTFNVDLGTNESVTISNLELGKTYYFAVTAYNTDGIESGFSDEISYPNSTQKPLPWIPLLLLDD